MSRPWWEDAARVAIAKVDRENWLCHCSAKGDFVIILRDEIDAFGKNKIHVVCSDDLVETLCRYLRG